MNMNQNMNPPFAFLNSDFVIWESLSSWCKYNIDPSVLFHLSFSRVVGSLSQLFQGERRGTPWIGRQSAAGLFYVNYNFKLKMNA